MMSEAAAMIVAATLSAVAAPLIAIAGKRWIEDRPARRNLFGEVEKLWERCDQLQEDLDECKEDHKTALVRADKLAEDLAALVCRRDSCPGVGP